jgi:hypothetical protein
VASDDRWVRTDEAEDVAASVRHALRSWAATGQDPQTWKWVALALHSALQGACVCHVVTTAAPVGAVTDKNAGEWLAYFEASRGDPSVPPPKTFLLSLPDLLKAVRKANSAGRGVSTPIAVSSSELVWLRRFNDEIRNQFVHFEPQGWLIEVSGMPQLAGLVSRIISDISDAGWAFRHKRIEWQNHFRQDLGALSLLAL